MAGATAELRDPNVCEWWSCTRGWTFQEVNQRTFAVHITVPYGPATDILIELLGVLSQPFIVHRRIIAEDRLEDGGPLRGSRRERYLNCRVSRDTNDGQPILEGAAQTRRVSKRDKCLQVAVVGGQFLDGATKAKYLSPWV